MQPHITTICLTLAVDDLGLKWSTFWCSLQSFGRMDVSSGGWTPFSVSRFEMENTGFGLGLTWGRKKKVLLAREGLAPLT